MWCVEVLLSLTNLSCAALLFSLFLSLFTGVAYPIAAPWPADWPHCPAQVRLYIKLVYIWCIACVLSPSLSPLLLLLYSGGWMEPVGWWLQKKYTQVILKEIWSFSWWDQQLQKSNSICKWLHKLCSLVTHMEQHLTSWLDCSHSETPAVSKGRRMTHLACRLTAPLTIVFVFNSSELTAFISCQEVIFHVSLASLNSNIGSHAN